MTALDRRAFLAAAATGAGGLLLPARPALAAARRRQAVPIARDVAFPQGIASGQPTTQGVTLWTQVAGLDRDARLQVEISPDADFRRVVYRRTVTARRAAGFTIHQRVDLGALRPGEQYHYRFLSCTVDGPAGRFRTALPADSREPVRVAFFSCQDYESGYYTAHEALAAEPDVDLAICLGDYIYEKSFEEDPVRRDQTGANRDGEVMTLAEYRDKYALYHADASLRAVRAAHPLVAIWDDHEVEDNYAAGRPGDAAENRRGVSFEERRAAGYRAFFEHMPRVRVPEEPDRIYGSLRLGANAEVFLLDERQYRDDQPCGDQLFVPCAEAEAPGRTLLGVAQKEWLKAALAGSGATWKLVGTQLMAMAFDTPAGNAINKDQYDGYAAERRELMEFVRERGIGDVSFLTGDIHTFFAGRVTPSGRQDATRSPAAVATEFVGGSITSKGVADLAGPARDAAAIPADPTILANNPHYAYVNSRERGYGVLEARPDELLVAFKAPQTTARPEATTRTLARFRVARGVPDVEVLQSEGQSARPAASRRRRRRRRT